MRFLILRYSLRKSTVLTKIVRASDATSMWLLNLFSKFFKAAFLFPPYSVGKRQLSQNTLVHKILKQRSAEINSAVAHSLCDFLFFAIRSGNRQSSQKSFAQATPQPAAHFFFLPIRREMLASQNTLPSCAFLLPAYSSGNACVALLPCGC